MHFMDGIESIKPGAKLTQVEPITRRFNTYLTNEDEIDEYVELPLRSACKFFWKKNVRTSGSCANKLNIEKGHPATINLDFLSLSPENQKRVAELIQQNRAKMIWNDTAIVLYICPVDEETSVEDVSQAANALADSFHNQPPNWVPASRIQNNFWNDGGGFYDAWTGLHYVSQSHRDLILDHQKKDPFWVPHFSLKQLVRDQLTRDGNVASDFDTVDPKYNQTDFWVREMGYYYYPETDLFYLSEQDCLKSKSGKTAENIRGGVSNAVDKATS